MAFPTAAVYDTFNRADENPLATASGGSSWATIPDIGSAGLTTLKLVSNQCAANSSSNQYLNVTDAADCEHYATVATLGVSTNLVDLLIRLKDVGSVFTIDGYSVKWTQAAGTDTIVITRVDNLGTTVLATFNQEMAAGDSFGIRMIGSTLEVFYVSGAGSWTSLGTTTDSTYAAGGIKAITVIGTSIRVDNAGGGNYVAPAGNLITPFPLDGLGYNFRGLT